MKALDAGYTFVEVLRAFNIPRSSLRDHYLGKGRNRKIGAKRILGKKEDEVLSKYILEMAAVALPLTPT